MNTSTLASPEAAALPPLELVAGWQVRLAAEFPAGAKGQLATADTVMAVDFQLHLETETVEHAHPAKPLCAAPEDSIRHVMRMLKAGATGAAMICREGRLLGVFTERDALKLLADRANLDAPVAEVMVREPVTLRTDDTVGKAIGLMAAGGFRRLPVVDGQGRVTGVLKVSGILRYLVDHFPKTVYTLPPAPHHKTVEREGA